METKVAQNGYMKGMDMDSSITIRDPNSYYKLVNGQVVTESGLSTGAIENVKGNELTFELPGGITYSGLDGTYYASFYDMTIIGSVSVKDYLILFTTQNVNNDISPDGTDGQVWLLNIDSNGVPVGLVNGVIPNTALMYAGIMNFSTYNRVKAVGFYSNSSDLTVYWTDGYNILRRLNLLNPNIRDTEIDNLSIVTPVNFARPLVTNVTQIGSTSEYEVGSIEYSYQLYDVNGVATGFSPTSQLVPLTDDDPYDSDSLAYYGAEQGEPSGKAISVTVNNIDTRYDNIKVVSLHYKTSNDTPSITIVYEGEVIDTVSFVDSGSASLGTLTWEEFSTLKNSFVCKDIETKDNILFASNVNYNRFEISDYSLSGYYDARAFRWKGVAGNEFICGTIDDENATGTNPALIDSGADCIATKENQYEYKFQQNSHVYGGQGLNVKYEFTVIPMPISNGAPNMTQSSGVEQTWPVYFEIDDDNFSVNSSFSGFASPINAGQMKSYQRDEIYRFGIVFHNIYGQKSYVEWIGDIKMPAIYEYVDSGNVVDHAYWGVTTKYYKHFAKSSGGVPLSLLLGLKFTVDTSDLSDDIIGYEIVRMRRRQSDKTVVSQGLVGGTSAVNDKFEPYRFLGDIEKTRNFPSPWKMITPEVSFFKGKYISDNFDLNIVGMTGSTISFDDSMQYSTKKIIDVVMNDNFFDDREFLIDAIKNSKRLNPGEEQSLVPSGDTCINYYGTDIFGAGGLFFNHEFDLSYLGGFYTIGEYLIANITASGVGAYGGNTFNRRSTGEYIETGSYKRVSDNTTTVFSGDTIIDYFDCLTNYWVSGDATSAMFIPVESTLNLRYRSDVSAHRNVGTHIHSETEQYKYNEVYSRESRSVKMFPRPFNVIDNELYEARIINSQQKYPSELVDSWATFLTEDYIDVNTTNGPIYAIKNWKNRLFYFQKDSIGVASVNERALYSGTTSASLSLGTGGVLDRYDYVSNNSGTKYKESIIGTDGGLYFIDQSRRNISAVTDSGSISLTDRSGVSSLLHNLDNSAFIDNNSIYAGYDRLKDRVYFTLKESSLDGTTTTVCYNELIGAFESLISANMSPYITTRDWLYTENGNDGKVYLHGYGERGSFYGEEYPMELTIVVNDQPAINKVFNTIEFKASEAINNISYWNDGGTGEDILTYGENLKKRLNQWRFNEFRYSSKGRVRGQELFIKLKYDNASGDKFLLYNTLTTYLFNIS